MNFGCLLGSLCVLMITLPGGLAGVCLFDGVGVGGGGRGGSGDLSLLKSLFCNMYLCLTEAGASFGNGTCFFLVSLNVKLPLKVK